HLVPVWFSWDGERLVVASKPDAIKVRNVRANPQVMVALGEAEDDFDVGLVEAEADLPAMPSADVLDDAHFEKYAHQLAEIGLTRDEYLATYAQPIVIRPTRFLPWHGRTVPASAAPANAAPQAALPERLPGWLRGGQVGWPRTWRGGPRTWLRGGPRTWLPRPMRRAFA
ncbi:MAG TPA: pyridoxamine 5'-phosphate oxidase family protein, partial [Candidatus Limnocylindrales bacterium]|nr:pyridoxamine 5'-phosphate oxidase family protein [Candidatus Limnocylindrales bacterium]